MADTPQKSNGFNKFVFRLIVAIAVLLVSAWTLDHYFFKDRPDLRRAASEWAEQASEQFRNQQVDIHKGEQK